MDVPVRAELLKLRTTRALPVTAALLVAFAVAAVTASVLLAGQGDTAEPGDDALSVLTRVPAQLVAGGSLLLGVLLVGGEHRHRTRVLSALVEPRRGRQLAAQLLALATAGALLATLVWAVAGTTAVAALLADGRSVHLATGPLLVLLATAAGSALLAVLGGAVAAVVGGTTGAVGIALGWAFVVEGVVPVVLREPSLADRLPGGALSALLAAGPGSDRPLSPLAGALLLAVAAAAGTGAAAAVSARREL